VTLAAGFIGASGVVGGHWWCAAHTLLVTNQTIASSFQGVGDVRCCHWCDAGYEVTLTAGFIGAPGVVGGQR